MEPGGAGQRRRDTLPLVIGALLLMAIFLPRELARPGGWILVGLIGVIAWVVSRFGLEGITDGDEEG